jgi:hypothetical protein
LKKRGLQAEVVAVKPGAQPDEAVKAATAAGKDRALILELRQWRSDTFMNTALHYDIEARVCDAAGRPLATLAKQGDEDLGGNFIDPPGHAKDVVPPTFKAILERLLNAPEIVAALR